MLYYASLGEIQRDGYNFWRIRSTKIRQFQACHVFATKNFPKLLSTLATCYLPCHVCFSIMDSKYLLFQNIIDDFCLLMAILLVVPHNITPYHTRILDPFILHKVVGVHIIINRLCEYALASRVPGIIRHQLVFKWV
eukprot:g65305.t1